MKNFINAIVVALVTISCASCQRNTQEATFNPEQNKMAASALNSGLSSKPAPPPAVCNPNAYSITLESQSQVNANWEWVWSVQNTNPGNGKNGTVQDLSHWGMQLAACANVNSVISAAYSTDGFNWTYFTPSYKSDPSQTCMTTPVLKFDFGTSGNTKTYYRLIVNENFAVGMVQGYYKSGVNTGCCTFYFNGIAGCGGPVEIEIVE
ncbi:MAG: hypothetical protein ACSLE0_21800 [Chitinophagaceae bacterium]